MRPIKSLKNHPAGLPLLADDILELHAARLLLLLKLCGSGGKISGLTKMAKLDFFVRYPKFFVDAVTALGKTTSFKYDMVESKMIRYHYGPWDERYYQILAFLESRGLIVVEKKGKTYEIMLTSQGDEKATRLALEDSFAQLANQMRRVYEVMGGKKGYELKELIYKLFDKEIAQLRLSEVIE